MAGRRPSWAVFLQKTHFQGATQSRITGHVKDVELAGTQPCCFHHQATVEFLDVIAFKSQRARRITGPTLAAREFSDAAGQINQARSDESRAKKNPPRTNPQNPVLIGCEFLSDVDVTGRVDCQAAAADSSHDQRLRHLQGSRVRHAYAPRPQPTNHHFLGNHRRVLVAERQGAGTPEAT